MHGPNCLLLKELLNYDDKSLMERTQRASNLLTWLKRFSESMLEKKDKKQHDSSDGEDG